MANAYEERFFPIRLLIFQNKKSITAPRPQTRIGNNKVCCVLCLRQWNFVCIIYVTYGSRNNTTAGVFVLDLVRANILEVFDIDEVAQTNFLSTLVCATSYIYPHGIKSYKMLRHRIFIITVLILTASWDMKSV